MQIVKFYGQGQYNSQTLIIQWNIGNVCNFTCEYCPPLLHDGSIGWIDNSIIKDNLLKIKNHYKDKKIHLELLGGEVTVKKDFPDLLEFCKENNFETIFFTNGSRTLSFWERILPYINRVVITFHPQHTIKEHLINLLTLLKNNNINFMVNVAIVKKYFDELILFCNELQQTFDITIEPLLLYDKVGIRGYNGFYYDYSEDQIKKVITITEDKSYYIAETVTGEIVHITTAELRSKKLNNFYNFTCGENFEIITIDFFGRASTGLCSQKPKINLYNDDIEKLFIPTLCKLKECNNPSDLRLFKRKIKNDCDNSD